MQAPVTMPADIERRGTVASDGLFAGPVVWLDADAGRRRPAGSVDEEQAALAAAVALALADIAALLDRTAGDAADIVGFQLALLEDDELVAPAKAAIATGKAADLAWNDALAAEIAGYETAEEEYFRARAADLRDVRDRVARHLAGGTQGPVPSGAVLIGDDIAPTRFLETDWSKGGAIVLAHGSTTAHAAMLARARGVPMLVGSGDLPTRAREAIVDAEDGIAIFDPSAATKSAYAIRRDALASRRQAEADMLFTPARLADETPVELLINVSSLDELEAIDPASCDGIGLMRSEFLFADGRPLPDEEQQYGAYMRLLQWAGDRPVTVRTLDIGGDKPIAGLTRRDERNPFLGLRGVRLALARPDVFRTQLRALARAAAHGTLKIMIPMVTVPDEITRTAALLDACARELKAEKRDCRRPPLGIMVEVPAVAICPERFAAADFFSIGSNDLAQYVTAASRDEPAVAALNDPADPAVLALIETTARFARANGIGLSICGDMAGEPAHLPALVKAGLRCLSVPPARLGRVKRALRDIRT